MKATNKAPQIDALLSSISGRDRVSCIDHMICTMCGHDALNHSFRDPISWKEYSISGMCQKCQDSVFGGDDE